MIHNLYIIGLQAIQNGLVEVIVIGDFLATNFDNFTTQGSYSSKSAKSPSLTEESI